ncbi:P-loop containing nucleoside triphosphate hydrolase protein [Spinellus fusiger]|nr:P-loop containing nucleoside triphosphate hydrolase protein [Spinellus fusiger]
MLTFWNQHVIENKPGCLYVSGSPGTGKTAMLSEIIRVTEDDTMDLRTHQVNVVMINCMSVGEPKGIYTKLVSDLKGDEYKANQAMDIVQEAKMLLNGTSNILNVVVLDEIDHLITKDQDVLYKIFEWASVPSSRLVLIGIANALDLTDRILPRLRAKNCEPQLLNFNPYKVEEITSIIKDRLYSLVENEENPFGPAPTPNENTPLPLMQPVAVELCARKVAAAMGDLRTALDVCRQAIDMAEIEWKKKVAAASTSPSVNGVVPSMEPKVTVAHIVKVLQVVYGSPTLQKLKQLNIQQKVVMSVLMVMTKLTRESVKSAITLAKFREDYRVLCSKHTSSISPVSRTELSDLLSMIETTGMISFTNNKEERLRRIQLNIIEDDIMQMVRSDSTLDVWVKDILEDTS